MKVLCFDLDGTLLPMDQETFIKAYVKQIAMEKQALLPAEALVKHIFSATETMVKNNDATLTNEEVFRNDFVRRAELSYETVEPVFDRFYRDSFPLLQRFTQPTPLARAISEEALAQRYHLVVATNAVFPRTAIVERLKWAGVADLPFALVTSYETTHFCKPNPAYYVEICRELGCDPADCVMIGNDAQEDMVASEVGMRTFWVTDCAIDRGSPQYRIDARGTLRELYEQLQQRRGLFAE